MNKNTVIGVILIVLVFVGFNYLTKPSKEQIQKQKIQHYQDSINQILTENAAKETAKLKNSTVEQTKNIANFFSSRTDSITTLKSTKINNDQIITLENKDIRVMLSTKGGQIVNVLMKHYLRYDKDSLSVYGKNSNFALLFQSKDGKLLRTDDLTFSPILSQDKQSVTMHFAYSATQYVDFIYSLPEKDYMLKYNIKVVGMQPLLSRDKKNSFDLEWIQVMGLQEKSVKNAQTYSQLYYKYWGGDVKNLSNRSNDKTEVTEPVKWIAFKNQFFASILIADDQIENSLLNSNILKDRISLKDCHANLVIPAKVDRTGTMKAGFSYYFGPMGFSHLRHYDKHISDPTKRLDLDKLIPLGWALFRWINQYFFIPVFNFFRSIGFSVGLCILLLTLIVKIIISPLTYKAYISSAKMRVLKPEIDEINAKYPNKDQAMEKQKATMDLYHKVGINPMSGCLLMVPQLPFLYALFRFFPDAIELRQQGFLWAKDLSTYDAIIHWNTAIPLLGNHLSLFCILMSIANVIYTKYNMDSAGQQQMAGMKWMSYLMPLFFLVFLNNYPAGLNFYYFLSLLISILLTLIFRFSVNEDKLLLKLQANKAKPKKKSGFMARLQEAQKVQQQQTRERNKVNSTKRKRY